MARNRQSDGAGANNNSLHSARKIKNDEFYTQLTDIEKELKHYKAQLNGMVVLCNCDDPTWSNFWIHFIQKFDDYGLKKVIATHYEPNGGRSYKLEFAGTETGIVRTELEGDGDFRSPECIELLKEADLVVTNPPFSLFRAYVAQLVEHKKKFLIIGNNNAITYKEIFKLISGNEIWLGVSHPKQFKQPDGVIKSFGNIGWFTNLPHKKRNEELTLFREYAGNEAKYHKYDNFDAIEVGKVANIPVDYLGAMGVPITFLDKYNPDQFVIIRFRKGDDDKDLSINGAFPYFRIIIKQKSSGVQQ